VAQNAIFRLDGNKRPKLLFSVCHTRRYSEYTRINFIFRIQWYREYTVVGDWGLATELTNYRDPENKSGALGEGIIIYEFISQ